MQTKRHVVEFENVTKDYFLGQHKVRAIDGITFSIPEGVFLAIAGPSGSGKSTVLNLMGCIDTPTEGNVRVAGHEVSGLTSNELADLRSRHIGFIFHTFNLFPILTAEENVEYPLLQIEEISKTERKKRVARFLDLVQLSKFAHHRPNQLSGGQRQRVAIARALVTDPDIVLADEPTANLDHKTGEGILALMKSINRNLGTTFVFSTHDQKVIDCADRLIGIEDGKVRYIGVRQEGTWRLWDRKQKAAETQQ